LYVDGGALINFYFHPTPNPAKVALLLEETGSCAIWRGAPTGTEGVHVINVIPAGTDTPMMKSNRAGPELGFSLEPAEAVAAAIVEAVEANALELVRGDEARKQMVALNQSNPAAIDERMVGLKPALEEAVQDHSAL
jgi:hypothetical protein